MTVLPLPREGKYKNPLFGSERNPGIKPITNRMGGASSDISEKCAACMLRFYQKDSKIVLDMFITCYEEIGKEEKIEPITEE